MGFTEKTAARQCQPASLVNERAYEYAGRHWTGAMAGDARVGGREAGAETVREGERGGWVVNGRHFGVGEGDEQDGNARQFGGSVPVRLSYGPCKKTKRVARTQQQLDLTFCCPYEHTFLAARGD